MAVEMLLSAGAYVSIARSGVRLEARSADRAELISPGAPIKSKGYIIRGVALCSLGSSMGSNRSEIG